MLYKPNAVNQKPVCGSQLNRGNGLSRGLILCYPFNERGSTPAEVNKYYATSFVVPADISWNNSLHGSVLRFAPNANRHYLDCGDRSEVGAVGQLSIFVRCMTTTLAGGGNNLRNIIDKNTVDNGWILRLSTANDRFEFFIHNGAYRGINTANSSVVANRWYNICCIYNTGASTERQKMFVYRDGGGLLVKVTANPVAGNITGASGIPISIGGNYNTGDTVREWQGDIGLAYLWNRALSDQEAMAILQNPYQIFIPKKRTIFIQSAGLNLPLTGVSTSSVVGTLTLLISLTLSGISATASVDSVIPNRSIPLSGVFTTGSIGNLIPDRSILLSGNQITVSAGTVSSGRSILLTGNSATASLGIIVPNRTINISGNQASGLVGTVIYSAGGDLNLALTGVPATGSVGNATPNRAISISNNLAIGNLGSLIPTQIISGISAIGSTGTVTPNRIITISGNQMTGFAGIILPAKAITLLGNQATGSVGTSTLGTTITLSGISSIGNIGNLIVSGPIIIKKINFTNESLRSPNANQDGLISPKATGDKAQSPYVTDDNLKTANTFDDQLIGGH